MPETQKLKLNRLRGAIADADRSAVHVGDCIGLRQSSISRLVGNKSQPGIETLFKIALLLECEPGDLLRSMTDIPDDVKEQWKKEFAANEPEYRAYREEFSRSKKADS